MRIIIPLQSFRTLLPALFLTFWQPTFAEGPITHQISLPSGMSWCEDALINSLINHINTFRAQNGLPALALDSVGMKVAEIRATQFAVYMNTHTQGSPGFNPHEGWDTTAASLGYSIVSENLAFSLDPGYTVYAVWQSTLHRAALLSGSANVMGVSCVYHLGSPYWTYEPGISSNAPSGGGGGSSGAGGSGGNTGAGNSQPGSEEWAFLTLINNFRAQNGAGPLQISAALQNAATWMSTDMATKNYANHTDSLGRSPGTRIAAFGYTYSPWGENIAGGYSDAPSVFQAWTNACDPGPSGACTYAHRVNMLNPAFRVIGIGFVYNANSAYKWYWTTDFGGVVDATIPAPGGGTPSEGSAPSILSFTASPSSISNGQSTTLSWNVTGATTITIDNGVGQVTNTNSRTVSPAQTTTYRLTASNGWGSSSGVATVTVGAAAPAADRQAPTSPVLHSAAPQGSTRVNLAWSASTDNVSVAGYQVVRNGAVLVLVTGSVLAYSDANASPGTTYTYAVRAYDAAGNTSNPSNSLQATTANAAAPPSSTCPAPATGAFTGCYYSNIDLSGAPAMVRTDNQINFDWIDQSPGAGIPADGYSVRWQGNFAFNQGGTYTFTVVASDGVRVYIDGTRILDRWRDQPVYYFYLRPTVTQGNHLITMEYYERTRAAAAHLSWQLTSPSGQAPGQPPAISSFVATPSTISAGQTSTLSWTISGATSISIDNGVGNVSNANSRTVSPAQTTAYRMTASNNAGSTTALVTVTVNPGSTQDTQPPSTPFLSLGSSTPTRVDLTWTASTDNAGVAGYQLLRNGSVLTTVAGAVRAYTDFSVAGGASYTYALRAFDAAGNYSPASNSVAVGTPQASTPATSCVPASGAFTGCYYTNTDLAGAPAIVRTDSQINFNWALASPAPAIPTRNYSVRWQGNFVFQAGTYTFTALVSDGIRIYIDGNLILDRWRDQPVYYYVARPWVSQGTHLVTVEYYERTGMATAQVSWAKN